MRKRLSIKSYKKYADRFCESVSPIVTSFPIFWKREILPVLRVNKFQSKLGIVRNRKEIISMIEHWDNSYLDLLKQIIHPSRFLLVRGCSRAIKDLESKPLSYIKQEYNLHSEKDIHSIRDHLKSALDAYNKDFVIPICKHYQYLIDNRAHPIQGLSLDDVKACCKEALLMTVHTYDFSRKTSFITLYNFQLKDALLVKGVINESYLVYVPYNKRDTLCKKYKKNMLTDEEIYLFNTTCSPSTITDVDYDDDSMENNLHNAYHIADESNVAQWEVKEEWRRFREILIDFLSKEEYEILCSCLGLFNHKKETFVSVANRMKVSSAVLKSKFDKVIAKIKGNKKIFSILKNLFESHYDNSTYPGLHTPAKIYTGVMV